MKKRNRLFLLLAAFIIAAVLLLQVRGESTGIFYRISGGKADLHILGSIHIGSREMYPLSRSIRNAISQADLLVFECDTESDAAKAETAQWMYYPPDDSLDNHIGPEVMEKLENVSRKLGYASETLKRFKPWAVTSMLSVETTAAQMGNWNAADASALGVEKQVRRLAGKKEIRTLETAGEQLGMMDAFSPALQEYLLDDACSTILLPEADEELKKWPEWWANGDAEAFAESYRRSMREERDSLLAHEYHDSMISRRNRSMAEKLRELLEQETFESCFVTVGLMHLVLEEDSILAELQNMGYTVEKIEN